MVFDKAAVGGPLELQRINEIGRRPARELIMSPLPRPRVHTPLHREAPDTGRVRPGSEESRSSWLLGAIACHCCSEKDRGSGFSVFYTRGISEVRSDK